jgi:hypothetical protein
MHEMEGPRLGFHGADLPIALPPGTASTGPPGPGIRLKNRLADSPCVTEVPLGVIPVSGDEEFLLGFESDRKRVATII